MPIVSRDATKGWWLGATLAEVQALLSGRLTAVPDPVSGWKMQETSPPSSTNVDFIGGVGTAGDLTPSGMTFSSATAGWSRVGMLASPEGGVRGSQNGFTLSGSLTEFFVKHFTSATPSSTRILNYLGGAVLAQDASGHIGVGDAAPTINFGAVPMGATDHPIVHVANASTSKSIVYTDQETVTLTGTYAPATNRIFTDDLGGFGIGNVNNTTLYMLLWIVALTATQAAILIDATINGPAIASVAVTPGPVTFGLPGDTQQLTCTATRVDTSTYDATNDTRTVWGTDNAGVATVSASGLVTAVAPGTCNITATTTSLNTTPRASSVSVAVAAIAPPNKYSRMMMALLPPGRVWRLIGESLLSAIFAGSADELGRLDARTTDLLNEADPSTAVELLPEHELELELDSSGTNAERQARIVARLVARQRYRPVDFQTALAPLLAQDADDVVVIERTHAFAASIGDDREIFRFFIYRNPALPGTYFIASAQALVDKIKPSHTLGQVIESISALYDDPHTLYDRDLRGA